MAKILVADDEKNLRRLICDYLKLVELEYIEAFDGADALEKFRNNRDIDAVICDIMMPEIDGWEVCRQIRKESNVPIIVLTARTQEFDELNSFECGADDFITKPFSCKVLVKRVEALLKRADISRGKSGNIITLDGLEADVSAQQVKLNGERIELSFKEFKLLEKLLSGIDSNFTRDCLLDYVWGINYTGEIRVVDSHVGKLRSKLGTWGLEHIKTVFGMGYKIVR